MVSDKYSIMEHYFYPTVILATVLLLIVFACPGKLPSKAYLMGGEQAKQASYQQNVADGERVPVISQDAVKRFLRSSNQPALIPRYGFKYNGEGIPKVFNNPRDVVEAYFNILSEAANMEGYTAGCGSIGEGTQPYPYAYEMLSADTKKTMTYNQFLNSFRGIGHINLLKIYEMNKVKINKNIYPRFLVELETIEGSKDKPITYFGYYTGEVIVQNQGQDGWKIRELNLKGEDFLCHPYHGWGHDAKGTDQIKYGIEKIYNVNDNGITTEITGQAKDGKQYKLTFKLLTSQIFEYLCQILL